MKSSTQKFRDVCSLTKSVKDGTKELNLSGPFQTCFLLSRTLFSACPGKTSIQTAWFCAVFCKHSKQLELVILEGMRPRAQDRDVKEHEFITGDIHPNSPHSISNLLYSHQGIKPPSPQKRKINTS